MRLDVDDEAVGEDGPVGRLAGGGDGGEQRRLEPAAMLVAAFEIEIGGEVQARGAFATTAAQLVPESIQTSSVSRPFFRPSGRSSAAASSSADAREPDARAFLLDEVGECAHDLFAQERLLALAIENGQGNAPGALARDAPVGPGFDRAADAVAAVLGNPLHAVDGRERVGAEGVDLDEPLLHRAENDGRLRAPAVG